MQSELFNLKNMTNKEKETKKKIVKTFQFLKKEIKDLKKEIIFLSKKLDKYLISNNRGE